MLCYFSVSPYAKVTKFGDCYNTKYVTFLPILINWQLRSLGSLRIDDFFHDDDVYTAESPTTPVEKIERHLVAGDDGQENVFTESSQFRDIGLLWPFSVPFYVFWVWIIFSITLRDNLRWIFAFQGPSVISFFQFETLKMASTRWW